jgi:nitrile hydratase
MNPDSMAVLVRIVSAVGEQPAYQPGNEVRVAARSPIGHYRVPMYLRGKRGVVESVIEPRAVDNEEEGYGRNAGLLLHYYRVAFAMTEVWPLYKGSPNDGTRCEIHESWLERV